MRCLYAVFGCKHFCDHSKLFSTAIYNLRRVYTTFERYILLSTVMYYFLVISRTYGLKARLKFNMSLLALIQSCFFWSSIVSFINFNVRFWKCCFIKNDQMLKMWNFLQFALQMVCKTSKQANSIHKLNP